MGKLTRRTSSSSSHGRASAALSSSMIMAVNDASQTARLVLDQQLEKKVKPSSGDDRSCISSAHQSFTGSLSSGVDDDDDDCNSSSTNSDNSTQLGGSRRSSRSTTNSRGGGSNKSMNSEDGDDTAGTTSPGGPPLSAFQNLPMSRRFAPSHLSPAGGIGGGVDNGTTTTATIDDFFANGGATTGGEYHVMNHFDTAVAISAALASSNLADAAGSNMGMLSSQLMSHNNNSNNNSYPTTKSKGRRKSNTENEISSFVVEGGGKQSITSAVTERTKSAGFVEGRRQSISTTTPTERTKSAGSSGLPTLEEAKAQMLLHRDSYSLPEIDFSFAAATTTKTTTTTDRTKLAGSSGLLPTLDEAKAQMLTNRDSYSLPEADITFVNRHNINDTSLSVLRASQLSQLSFDNQEVLSSSNNNDGQMIKSAVVGSNNKKEEEEGEEQQLLGSTSEHSNDNESNTSSVDGVNYSSDVSPITSEGSGENNKHNNGEVVSKVGILGTLKSRRPSYGGGVEDDEYSTNSERSDTRGGVIIASQKLKTQEEELTKRRIVTRDESISKVDDFNVARVGASMNDQVVVHSTEHPPAHRLSLFSSFDRRWEEAVEGKENSEQLLDLGKKCFTAFVSIFITSCIDSNGRSFFGDSSFRWWIDDDSLTNLDDIISMDKDTPQEIPLAVIRCLWEIAFFDSGAKKDEINHILYSIQHILVKDLCYLIVNETKYTTCLYLADNVYAEYGNYILEHLSLLKNQVTFWHSQFVLELRRLLTDSNFIDTDSTIKRRYAAQSLPRHTAIGLLDIDSKGQLQKDMTIDKSTDLCRILFDNLLCDKEFIHARAKLLGIGNKRPMDPFETSTDGVTNQTVGIINQMRDKDWNLQYATSFHLKDIDWCASFCISTFTESQNYPFDDAIVRWAEELCYSYHLLNGGKPTNSHDELSVIQEKEVCSFPSSSSSIDFLPSNLHRPSDVEDGVKSLLATTDAWTTKGSRNTRETTDVLLKESSFIKPRRKEQRRKSIGNPQENDASPLAKILKIDINEIRTSISVGHSFLSLTRFFQSNSNNYNRNEKSNKSSSVVSCVNAIQCSCLMKAIAILACSAATLETIMSVNNLDEDDLDETVATTFDPTTLLQLFAVKREDANPLLSIAGILSADAWYLLGKLVNEICNTDVSDHIMGMCFERVLLILRSSKWNTLSHRAVQLSCESLLAPVTTLKCFLQSNAMHALGVYYYEQGAFAQAGEHLDKAARFRRQMLEELGQDCTLDPSSLAKVHNYLVTSPQELSDKVFANVFEYSFAHARAHLPRGAFEMKELELNVSLTLEYCALNEHARQKFFEALALFQESLILRTIHVGKLSLDVASLHFNIGVVHDDLEQYDSATSRYHESLRIRLDQRNKVTSPSLIAELDDSILLTLKCMGRVYETVKDIDNAICCYVKVTELLSTKLRSHQDQVDEFDTIGLRLGLAVPVPTIILDDLDSKIGFQMMNRRELCHFFVPNFTKRRGRASVPKLMKELSKIHSNVIDLVHAKKQHTWNNESGSTRSKSPGFSSLLASLSSTFKTGRDAFETSLMRSSFYLGQLKLDQTRYEEASDHFETALRSKWALDPASQTSDSDSDFSRTSLSRRNRQQDKMAPDENDPGEGQLYYALGICNAAVDDHERAVRCFLTALRHLRKNIRTIDSLEVARVLFDCATSYYYLRNFEQSISFYSECLRILKSIGEEEEKDPFRRGVVLYCLVVAKVAVDFDSEISNLLNEAQNLMSGSHDKTILAYMQFLTAVGLHKAASQVPVRMRSITSISSSALSLDGGLSWRALCMNALNLFEQCKNECWFELSEGGEELDEVEHLPLSGHICFMKGQVCELLGRVDQALQSFQDAAHYYRIACGDENLYVASVLHRMGMICSQSDNDALGYFNEALSIRKNLLGVNNLRVSETLFSSANVLARLNRYAASMERYHEALRIQMIDNQDSNDVARTLTAMGICHYNVRAYDPALTCLNGAVKIRKHRMSGLTPPSDTAELYEEELALAADFFNLGNIHMQMGDYTQALQNFILSRDIRWRHVGSGTIENILDRYFSDTTVDEDELLGLAHCLHNIGVVFDIQKEYHRSKPHYEEALAIKNAIAGFSSSAMTLVNETNPEECRSIVLQSLASDDNAYCKINSATLSASVTQHKIALVYVKLRKFDQALFHFSHALRIQRAVLGNDHFRIGNLLKHMGSALSRTSSSNSDTAIFCYSESLRISRLRLGKNHLTVASAMLELGNMYDSTRNFSKAVQYYQQSLSVYRNNYFSDLTWRMCSGLRRPITLTIDGTEAEFLSTGDAIFVPQASSQEHIIREQYTLVTEALRRAKRRGERTGQIVDTGDAWLTVESLMFRFVEMLSEYVVNPAQTMVNSTINTTQRRIESAANHAVISAADALDYQFLLLMQE